MKTALRWGSLLFLILITSCASAPTGPTKPGMPWISEVRCPSTIPVGEMGRFFFRYQGDEYPDYAEVTLFKISEVGSSIYLSAPVAYRYEDQYEIPLKLSKNPASWGITFYIVDRKGRHSNELSCQITVR